MATPSYWGKNGKYSNSLLEEVESSPEYRSGNGKAVQKLRRAADAYYQALNNGNYKNFHAVFGVGGRQYADSYELVDLAVRTNSSLANDPNTFPTFRKVEAKLDALILTAHEEIYG